MNAKKSKNPKKGYKPQGDKSLQCKAKKAYKRQSRHEWLRERHVFTLLEERMAESMAGSL